MRKCIWFGAGLIVTSASASGAQAQRAAGSANMPQSKPAETPPDATTAPSVPKFAPSTQDEIIIIAPSERTSIDRTTYTVRDTAETRSQSAFDLLSQTPTVEVAPNGQLRLLGRSGPKILIDGVDVPNASAVLRSMQGSQIARIEIVTNPSAQFSAQGTGGIINVITRRSFARGFSGSVTAGLDSLGGRDVRISPVFSRGPLSVSTNLSLEKSIGKSELERDREALDPVNFPFFATSERGKLWNRNNSRTGNLTVTYQLDPKTTVSATARAGRILGSSTRDTEVNVFSMAPRSFSQNAAGRSRLKLSDLSANLRRLGKTPNDTLGISFNRSTLTSNSDQLFTLQDDEILTTEIRLIASSFVRQNILKVDKNWSAGENRRLAAGAIIQTSNERLFSSVDSGDDVIAEADLAESFDGRWREIAAYTTYQFPILRGTMLLGIRAEERRYKFTLIGGNRAPRDLNIFPSVHYEKRLTKWLVGNLSYSRRIAWPAFQNFNPNLRFSDPFTATSGNPALRPEITDAFEIKTQVTVAKQNIELAAFSNTTDRLFSTFSELNGDGILISSPVNLGSRKSLGLSLTARGSLGGGFSYSAATNWSSQKINRDNFDDQYSSRQYGGSLQLDYRDGQDGKRGADHVTFRIRYSGPVDLGLARTSAYVSSSASWSHAITDRLGGVVRLSDFIGNRKLKVVYVTGDTIAREVSQNYGPTFSAALTYSLAPVKPRQ